MKLISAGHEVHACNIFGPRMGWRYHRIALNYDDVLELQKLPPEMLKAWLDAWTLGFHPDAVQRSHK